MNKGSDHAPMKMAASDAKPLVPQPGTGVGGPSPGTRPYPGDRHYPEPIVNCDMGRES